MHTKSMVRFYFVHRKKNTTIFRLISVKIWVVVPYKIMLHDAGVLMVIKDTIVNTNDFVDR